MDITPEYVYLGYGNVATSAAQPMTIYLILILIGVALIYIGTRREKDE